MTGAGGRGGGRVWPRRLPPLLQGQIDSMVQLMLQNPWWDPTETQLLLGYFPSPILLPLLPVSREHLLHQPLQKASLSQALPPGDQS